MSRFLFYFALTGWALSLLIHLLSFVHIDATDHVPIGWLLQSGIFVVWVAAILKLRKDEDLKRNLSESKGLNNARGFLTIFQNTPQWMIVVAVAGFFYAAVNFILLTGYSGNPGIVNGQYVLQGHGLIIKTLTESEYHYFQAIQVRRSSGHWIAFYGIAAAVLFPFSKQVNKER